MPEITMADLAAIAVRLVTATVGTLGFALIFKVPPKRLPYAMLGGFITWLLYETMMLFTADVVVASFVSALVMALYSEIMARTMRAPTILFLLTGAVPIVPGNGLYQSIRSIMLGNLTDFGNNAKGTLATLLGITLGLGVASITVGIIRQIKNTFKQKQTKNNASL